jgi:Rrf2 family transcriptional regulator, cysteine metabolism repressor
MKISTRTRYGMRAMVEVAGGYPEKPVSLRHVAEQQAISLKYLEQLMIKLKQAGLIRSVRGLHGGYLLTCDPAEMNLKDIVIALEGPLALVDCVANAPNCKKFKDCVTRALWEQMTQALVDVLDGTTLADLAAKAKTDCGQK